MPDPWPDAALERQMLADAELLEACPVERFNRDCAYHIRALLERVRTLETAQAEYADVLGYVLDFAGPPLARDRPKWQEIVARANRLLGRGTGGR